jgi:hypothetical protein
LSEQLIRWCFIDRLSSTQALEANRDKFSLWTKGREIETRPADSYENAPHRTLRRYGHHDRQNRPPQTIHIVQDVQRQKHAPRLAAISNHMDTGDITTLAKPDIVEQIREQVQGR